MRELTLFIGKVTLWAVICFITAPLAVVLVQMLLQADWSWLWLLPVALVSFAPTLFKYAAGVVVLIAIWHWLDGLSDQHHKLLVVIVAGVVLGGLVLRVLP